MNEPVGRPVLPFAVALILLGIVSLAVAQLPDLLLGQLRRARPLTDAQAGWAYRLLALAAVAQAVYVGFVLLRPERVEKARREQPKIQRMTREEIVAAVARNAASTVVLTVIYGLASIWMTGQRGGFWLFPSLALAQAAWYYREVGQVAGWMEHQPESVVEEQPRYVWQREPPDYCPPLVRGLLSSSEPTRSRERTNEH